MKLITICGPTACGKTRLAVMVARAFGAEIISADSRQVYRGLDLGTGKDLSEYSDGGSFVPYHLIDVVDPLQTYSLWNFQKDFWKILCQRQGRVPCMVLCGGTGMYVESILRDYQLPDVPENPELRSVLEKLSLEELVERLKKLDPARAAKTELSNQRRVIRALEIQEYERFQALDPTNAVKENAQREMENLKTEFGYKPSLECFTYYVTQPRPLLHERILNRLDERFKLGLVEEVQRLLNQGVPAERLKALGMEYKQVTTHLLGEQNFPTMREALLKDIRGLAKRQDTWFRGMARRGVALKQIDIPERWNWKVEISKAMGVLP